MGKSLLGLLLFFFFFTFFSGGAISPSYSQSEDTGPNSCDMAIEAYQKNRQSFINTTRDCLAEAGSGPSASLEDCPSVDREAFISLIREGEILRSELCLNCGTWPEGRLGPGNCETR